MFSAGDGHAVQGDGEFCVTALETSMHGRFKLTVLKRTSGDPVFKGIVNPRAETATHYLTMAFHEDLNKVRREVWKEEGDALYYSCCETRDHLRLKKWRSVSGDLALL